MAQRGAGNRTMRFEDVYHDQRDETYDDADEGGPLPKLTDDPADLAPFIPADKAAVLAALRLTGAIPGGAVGMERWPSASDALAVTRPASSA